MISDKTALILIDIQKDYFKGGKNELIEPEIALQNAKNILNLFRDNKAQVFHIQHINLFEGAPFFVKDSKGCEIHDMVKPIDGEHVLTKQVPNSFYHTGLDEILKKNGINNLVICGMMSHMCIDTSIRAAKDLGYQITLIEDACATMDLEWKGKKLPAKTIHEVYMASLSNVFANVIKANDYIKDKQM